jgi:hypothetical protein
MLVFYALPIVLHIFWSFFIVLGYAFYASRQLINEKTDLVSRAHIISSKREISTFEDLPRCYNNVRKFL